jgi:hypothetical protein
MIPNVAWFVVVALLALVLAVATVGVSLYVPLES